MAKAVKKINKSVNKTNLVVVVENSTARSLFFSTEKEARSFVNLFKKQYPLNKSKDSGYWVELLVTEISGKVIFAEDI